MPRSGVDQIDLHSQFPVDTEKPSVEGGLRAVRVGPERRDSPLEKPPFIEAHIKYLK